MFSAAREKIAKLGKVDVNSAFLQAITKPEILEVLVEDNISRLFIGQDANEQSLGQYADSKLNIARGKTPGDEINLYDTGAFYESIEAKETDNGVIIVGEMDKPNGDLAIRFQQDFGIKALGLSETDRKGISPKIVELMLPELKSQI